METKTLNRFLESSQYLLLVGLPADVTREDVINFYDDGSSLEAIKLFTHLDTKTRGDTRIAIMRVPQLEGLSRASCRFSRGDNWRTTVQKLQTDSSALQRLFSSLELRLTFTSPYNKSFASRLTEYLGQFGQVALSSQKTFNDGSITELVVHTATEFALNKVFRETRFEFEGVDVHIEYPDQRLTQEEYRILENLTIIQQSPASAYYQGLNLNVRISLSEYAADQVKFKIAKEQDLDTLSALSEDRSDEEDSNSDCQGDLSQNALTMSLLQQKLPLFHFDQKFRPNFKSEAETTEVEAMHSFVYSRNWIESNGPEESQERSEPYPIMQDGLKLPTEELAELNVVYKVIDLPPAIAPTLQTGIGAESGSVSHIQQETEVEEQTVVERLQPTTEEQIAVMKEKIHDSMEKLQSVGVVLDISFFDQVRQKINLDETELEKLKIIYKIMKTRYRKLKRKEKRKDPLQFKGGVSADMSMEENEREEAAHCVPAGSVPASQHSVSICTKMEPDAEAAFSLSQVDRQMHQQSADTIAKASSSSGFSMTLEVAEQHIQFMLKERCTDSSHCEPGERLLELLAPSNRDIAWLNHSALPQVIKSWKRKWIKQILESKPLDWPNAVPDNFRLNVHPKVLTTPKRDQLLRRMQSSAINPRFSNGDPSPHYFPSSTPSFYE